jgi:hypothetical protein
MVVNHRWKVFRGWRIRINAAWRCLRKNHYVLVCWVKCDDGDIDFKISHKGVELPEAAYRLRVDAAEILQEISDQEDALYETRELLKTLIPDNI